MKINDESSYILFCKRAFSDVLEDVPLKNISGSKPLDPYFLPVYVEKNTIYEHNCYLLAQMCNMQTFKVLNLTSISVPPQSSPTVYRPVVCMAYGCICHGSNI